MTTDSTAYIAYVPTPLTTLAEICKRLGVGERQVKCWVKAGAPIAVEGRGNNTRYSAEMARLLAWREVHSKAQYEAACRI